jgi:putative flippase GtrA
MWFEEFLAQQVKMTNQLSRFQINRNFLIFCVIGCANTAVNFAVVVTIIGLFDISQIYANVLAFVVANIFSFFANSTYNFKTELTTKNYVKFFSASLYSLIIVAIFSYVADAMNINYIHTFIFLALFSPLINYAMVRFVVFRS